MWCIWVREHGQRREREDKDKEKDKTEKIILTNRILVRMLFHSLDWQVSHSSWRLRFLLCVGALKCLYARVRLANFPSLIRNSNFYSRIFPCSADTFDGIQNAFIYYLCSLRRRAVCLVSIIINHFVFGLSDLMFDVLLLPSLQPQHHSNIHT